MAELGWILFALATAVCVAVFAALYAAMRVARRRASAPDADELPSPQASGDGDGVVVLTGMILPAVILAFTLGYTIFTLRSVAGIGGAGGATGPAAHADHGADNGAMLHPQTTTDASTLDVRITGKQWWWEISYPEAQVVTANEIHLPAGVPIRLTVTSEDVIHSFWVPQVAGKVDVIPGRFNTMTIRVDAPGTYRGMCSEFCGLQHARMHLFLMVHAPSDFAAWIASQQQPTPAPTDPLAQQGQQVFQRACAECHAVRGTGAAGRLGPDLTHVASRTTLGAGLHENTRANLESWVSDPQAMKPGNKMLRPDLSEADTQAILAYLELLK